ncbi:MAG: DUF1573 domain-containing protein [Bacteroidales bacterium]|nr:DUF1573 domain-containing protein [Bacteroidales bacterium]NLD64011.1 DUF1573 domain-containing protein [Bacteroidales bacterium]
MNRRVIINLIAGLTLTGVLISSCGRTKAGAAGYKPSDTIGTAILTFKSIDHDFGQVNAGEKVGCIFTYTNSGDADLVITSASASCGCTVPKFDKKPVAPGGSGTIEVIFDTSGREGMQTKTVVVQSNAENNLVILRIIADIIKSGK